MHSERFSKPLTAIVGKFMEAIIMLVGNRGVFGLYMIVRENRASIPSKRRGKPLIKKIILQQKPVDFRSRKGIPNILHSAEK